MNVDSKHAIAIVVTHNRKKLLLECVGAILQQSVACDVLVVDNASTDGTKQYLRGGGVWQDERVHYLRLEKNLGGSGGFHEGLKYCMSGAWDWFWFMDDDARPEKDALENLCKNVVNPNDIYGSVAVGLENEKRRLCFPAKKIQGSKRRYRIIEYYESLNEIEEVAWIPFLGLLISRQAVRRIGLPDPDFFVLNDDIEYCERAKRSGARIIIVKDSVILHPLADSTIHRFMGVEIVYRSMPPWKIYYNVRNKIIVAKRYHGLRLWTEIMPGIFFRAVSGLICDKPVLPSFYAHVVGTVDGLSNNTFRRFMGPDESLDVGKEV